MDNARIADRLDAFASLLELAEANPYTARAYRRAAETIRAAAVPVADLVASGKVRQLRGIGRSIEARLRELVETGDIAELAELERELSPELVGLGRYLGLTAKRSIELARALDIHTAEELREAAAAGRLRTARASARSGRCRSSRRSAASPSRGRAQGLSLTARVSWSGASPPRWAARPPATCAAGATPASTWPWSAPPPTPARFWPASPSCPRSSP